MKLETIKFSELDNDSRTWISELRKYILDEELKYVIKVKNIEKLKYRIKLGIIGNRNKFKIIVTICSTNGYIFKNPILEYYEKSSTTGKLELMYVIESIKTREELFNNVLKLVCSNI